MDLPPPALHLLHRLLAPMHHASSVPVDSASADAWQALRREGCTMTPVNATHLKLDATPLSVWREVLASRPPVDATTSRRVEVYPSLGSTMDAARRMIAAWGSHAHLGIVIAGSQTTGRGRHGRAWHNAPDAAVLMSLITQLPHPDAAARLTYLSAVAVVDALQPWLQIHGLSPHIKWPNDILIDIDGQPRKLSGILVETHKHQGMAYAITGIGLNVNASPPLDASAARPPTSLREMGMHVDRLAIALAVACSFDAVQSEPTQAWRQRWLEHCRMLGASHRFEQQGQRFTAHVENLDPDTGLIVRLETGELIHLPAATTTVV